MYLNLNHKVQFALILILIILSSCVNKSTKIVEWDGFYTYSTDIHSFEPCGLDSEEFWYIFGEDNIISELILMHQEIDNYDNEIYVRLKGEVSKMDSCDMAKIYDRKFKLFEILEVRNRTENDCVCDCE